MKVLSLFDGISCARVAIERAGIPVEVYFASEIDKYAIQISKKNYPDIFQLGDVKNIRQSASEGLIFPPNFRQEKWGGGIDLLIGGSPCQDLSIAKKDRKGLDGERSGLFWEYVRILKEVKPKYFILENVASMPKEAKELITKTLGVEPIMINAALVSAQNRKRLFWTNIPNVTQPEDRGILLKDILETGDGEAGRIIGRRINERGVRDDYNFSIKPQQRFEKNENPQKTNTLSTVEKDNVVYQYRRSYWRETKGGKVPTLTANMGTGGNNVPYIEQTSRGFNKGGKKFNKVPTISTSSWQHNHKLNGIRKLTPIECERLQGLPDNYTEGISNTQRYKCIGNAFNVDVVAHILTFI
jgi:DNA (cytosine-5)-methyltransferase 3A